MARWVLVGRRDGLRSRVRRAFGLFTWLDERATPSETATDPVRDQAPSAPREVSTPEAVPDGWIRVIDASEVAPGEVVEVLAGAEPVALANVDGTFFAVDSTCPHAGGPLGDGHLDGATLTCPWHGWSYDLRTGRSLVDESVCVAVRGVKVVHGGVYVQPL